MEFLQKKKTKQKNKSGLHEYVCNLGQKMDEVIAFHYSLPCTILFVLFFLVYGSKDYILTQV